MGFWRGYFGIENLALNATQRAQLIAVLRTLGPDEDPQPACLLHFRTRLDGQAAIFEARFNEYVLTIDKFKEYLANIFSIDPATIDHELTTPGGNIVVVFSRGGTDYLRLALFGGLTATWEESRHEVLAYLAANIEAWQATET